MTAIPLYWYQTDATVALLAGVWNQANVVPAVEPHPVGAVVVKVDAWATSFANSAEVIIASFARAAFAFVGARDRATKMTSPVTVPKISVIIEIAIISSTSVIPRSSIRRRLRVVNFATLATGTPKNDGDRLDIGGAGT